MKKKRGRVYEIYRKNYQQKKKRLSIKGADLDEPMSMEQKFQNVAVKDKNTTWVTI